jgi:PmbA protein
MAAGRKGGVPKPPWSSDEMLALGDRAVGLAQARGAGQSEAFLAWGVSTSVDIEGGRISYPMVSRVAGISIRVIKGGRLGFAYCTHPDMLERTVDRALEISRLGKALPVGFPGRAPMPSPKGIFDGRVLELLPDEGMRIATAIISEARSVDRSIQVTGGGVDFGFSEAALVNSGGLAHCEKGTAVSAGASVTLKGRTTSTGFDSRSGRSLPDDLPALGGTAARLAVASQNPVAIGTGKRPVVFTPEAAAELLGPVLLPALEGESAGRGESVYSGRLGQPVMDAGLTIADDGLLDGGLGTSACDDEGVPSGRNVLVENGVLRAFMYDLYTAAEFGARTTGNGARGSYRSPPSVSERNLVLEGALRDREAVIGEIREGILVHEVLGAHTANRVSGDFSVNAPLLFRIKDGEVGRPLKPVMLSGNLPELLKHVGGLGRDRKQMGSGAGALITGSVMVEGVMVTG